MLKVFILSFTAAHLLGDFYFQSPNLAEQKKGNYRQTFKHCLIYASAIFLVAVALYLYFKHPQTFLVAVILSVSHLVIDLFKCYLEKEQVIELVVVNYSLRNKKSKVNKSNRKALISAKLKETVAKYRYLIDQFLHVATILLVSFYLVSGEVSNARVLLVIQLVTYCLILMKPTNITFKVLFSNYQAPSIKLEEKGESEQEYPTIKGAGALIGSLERIIMGIFIYLSQFASIALILTAKTITRYNKIVTDPGFSEYYLIGTLYSILVPLVSYGLIFKL